MTQMVRVRKEQKSECRSAEPDSRTADFVDDADGVPELGVRGEGLGARDEAGAVGDPGFDPLCLGVLVVESCFGAWVRLDEGLCAGMIGET